MAQFAGSFTDWSRTIPLRKVADTGDFARSVVLPPGPIEYKFVIDSVWRHSPRDALRIDVPTDSINNQRVRDATTNARSAKAGADERVFGIFFNH